MAYKNKQDQINYRIKNRELLNKKKREKYHSEKDGFYRVYLLEDYNYVGQTSTPLKERFRKHRVSNNRDCTNYRVLYKTKSKEEALELEALLHDLGYEGRGSRF